MTERAREVLAAVDLIACEDTRRTRTLLSRFAIVGRTVSFFEGNERERVPELLAELRAGRDVAVVSDAGMPGLSDPGYRLVRACVEEDVEVIVVPGPSSAVSALVVSGLPCDRFSFEGFLPRKTEDRRARLAALAPDERTLVFFESPRRVLRTLEEMLATFGDRRVAVARELTKLHEEVVRGKISEVSAKLAERGGVKGEIVIVVGGAEDGPATDMGLLVAEARNLVAQGMRRREAAREIARRHGPASGARANDIYEALLAYD
jgi:16S rRNA (cytidine1402-2'-O)-methyltransferase